MIMADLYTAIQTKIKTALQTRLMIQSSGERRDDLREDKEKLLNSLRITNSLYKRWSCLIYSKMLYCMRFRVQSILHPAFGIRDKMNTREKL